ncbi:MAG: sugar ABC transporter substrate-binding protein [Clostridiales bacterium]|nr:sugar ABC transporter substrate-binding protein [Clostridiales bacterium]
MKKTLALLLAVAMMLALVPAVLAEDLEPITVTVFRGDPGDQPTEDNKIYKLIEEEFGIKFEFEFLAGDLDETLGLKIAGGVYPDLFDGGNSAEMLENADVLIDMLPYISEEKTPNLYKHIYTENRIAQLLDDDGHLHIIPNYGINYNGQVQNAPSGPQFFLQKQVIEFNDYVVPTTLNEYFDLIERFIAANPVNADGTPYTGFAILCEDWRHFCLINPVQHLMGRPNDGEVIVDVNTDAYTTTTFINQPYAKDYYKKLNEEFNKGIISRDTFVMNYDQYIAALSNGTVLGMFDQAWDFGGATAALNDAGMYANTFIGMPLVYDESYGYGVIEEHYVNGTVMNKDRGFGISVTCEDPERMIMFFEELLSDRWQIILQWGIEGEDYYVENGRFLMTDEQYANLNNSEWKRANKANTIWESCPKKQGLMDDGNAWAPGDQAEIYFGQMNAYDIDFYAKLGVRVPGDLFDMTLELAPYGEAWQIDKTPIEIDYEDFNNIQDKRLPELIMAAPADFDALWDAFVEEINPSCEVYSAFMQAEVLKLVEQALGN